MKCCYQSDYSNEKITWLEKEGATQLKIIKHSGADHNGDFGKITEKSIHFRKRENLLPQ